MSLCSDGYSAKTVTKRFCEAAITLKRPFALTLLIARARFTESAKANSSQGEDAKLPVREKADSGVAAGVDGQVGALHIAPTMVTHRA